MRLEDLQAAARELPQHQPGEAQRVALRASLVEAARTERPERPRRRVRIGTAVALGGALAAAAAAAVWWSWSSGQREGRATAAAELGARRATIQSSSGAHFEHTRVHGPPAGDAPGLVDEVVRLRQGRVAVAVEHLARGERFRVVTGDAEVEVRGTAFDVVVEGDLLVEVVVHSGLVEVRPEGREALALHPGERWRRDQRPVRAAALEPAAPAPAPEPTLEPPVIEPRPVPAAPAAPPVAPLARRAERIPEPEAQPLPDRAPVADSPARAPTGEQPAAATQGEPPAVTVKPAPTASEVAFARGFRALRRGDYGEASDQFDAAIASGPGSPLLDDARYWRAVALARSGRTAGARDALVEFLRLHGRSPRAGEASVMLGWMLLEAGERTGAFRRFKAAAGDRDPAVRASADKGLAAIRER